MDLLHMSLFRVRLNAMDIYIFFFNELPRSKCSCGSWIEFIRTKRIKKGRCRENHRCIAFDFNLLTIIKLLSIQLEHFNIVDPSV